MLSCTLRPLSSVSRARNRKADDWVFWDSYADTGASVPRCDGTASVHISGHFDLGRTERVRS